MVEILRVKRGDLLQAAEHEKVDFAIVHGHT